MAIFKKVKSFFERRYWLFLLMIVLISFGQTLWMGVWLDDQGLFFKFAHVYEKAGYLGIGPIGEGLYKYVITPFIPIYNLFGYQVWMYFLLGLIFYTLAVFSVYFVFKRIIGETGGRVAGFLYAAGYIASDATIRVITTILTSLGIIFSSFWLLFYWKFYKQKNSIWYLFSIFFYVLALEFSRVRTHYLLVVIVVFEVIFLMFKKPLFRSIVLSIVRLIPFYLVYHYYFGSGSNQDGKIGDFISKILSGDFSTTYGGLSTFSGVFVHDWIASFIVSSFSKYSWLFVLCLLTFVLALALKRTRHWFIGVVFSMIIFSAWWFVTQGIFSSVLLNLKLSDIFLAYLGGSVLFFLTVYGLALTKKKGLYSLFLIWSVVNVAAYGIYTPNVYYPSVSRYLAHSFLPGVGLLSVIFIEGKEKQKINFAGIAVLVWGLFSLGSAVIYQHDILLTRSFPVERFYSSLKSYVGNVAKGDIFYFSVADEVRNQFNAATSVASMPESTSIAWRYGVDRYDIYYFTDFKKLVEFLEKDKSVTQRLHAFYYSGRGLTDITDIVNGNLARNTVSIENNFAGSIKAAVSQELVIDLEKQILGYSPNIVTIRLKAAMPGSGEISFSGAKRKTNGSDFIDSNLIVKYSQFKDRFRKAAQATSSSYWRDEKTEYAIDGNINTDWRPDRVAWTADGANLTLDLKKPIEIDRLVWVNAFGNSTPTEYAILVSNDSRSWKEVSKVKSVQRIDTKIPNEIKFEKVEARYVKMNIMKTLNQDSPGISEIWVVPAQFAEMNIKVAETRLEKLFDSPPDMETLLRLISIFGNHGRVRLYWSNGDNDWETSDEAFFEAVYDGKTRDYTVILPATNKAIVKRLKLGGYTFPGTLEVFSVFSRPLTLDDLKQ